MGIHLKDDGLKSAFEPRRLGAAVSLQGQVNVGPVPSRCRSSLSLPLPVIHLDARHHAPHQVARDDAVGLGVAFMLDMHLQEARDDRLVQLFESVPSPYSYWFACRRAALGRRPVKLLHDWLVGELGEAG